MEISTLGGLPTFGSPTLEGFDVSNPQLGQRIGGNSKRQFVRFYKKKIVNPRAVDIVTNSFGDVKVLKVEAEPVEREMVEVVTPGDKNIIDDFAQEYHRREFWNQYKAYRDGRVAPQGMSIDEASFVSPHLATELRYRGVQTVEQLADASDTLCEMIPTGWELRECARAVVKANCKNDENKQVLILQAELQETRKMLAQMQTQMNNISEQKEVITVETRKAGRPKKIQEESNV